MNRLIKTTLLVILCSLVISCQNDQQNHNNDSSIMTEASLPLYQTGVLLNQIASVKPISLGLDSIYTSTFSSDGEYLAVSSEGIYLYNSETSELLWHDYLNDALTALAYQPQGAAFATGSQNGLIAIWPGFYPDYEYAYIAAHSQMITSLAFSPDGLILASASSDQTVKLWNMDGVTLFEETPTQLQLETDVSMQQLTMHNSQVNAVSWSSTGLLASGDQNGEVIIWEGGMQGEASPIYFRQFEQPVSALSFHPESDLLLIGLIDGQIIPWDISGNLLLPAIGYSDSEPSALAWSNDGSRVACVHFNGTIEIIRIDGESEPLIVETQAMINDVTWSPDDQQLALGIESGQLLVLDIANVEIAANIPSPAPSISSLDWSIQNGLILIGTQDGFVFILDTNTHQYSTLVNVGPDEFTAMEAFFNPQGNLIAVTCHDSGNIFIFETETKHLITTLNIFDFWVDGTAWSPDGTYFAGIGRSDKFEDEQVRALIVWDTNNWERKLSLTFDYFSDNTSNIVFNPDSDRIATIIENNVLVWQVETGILDQNIELASSSSNDDLIWFRGGSWNFCLVWLPESDTRTPWYDPFNERIRIYIEDCADTKISPNGDYLGVSNNSFVTLLNSQNGERLYSPTGSFWFRNGKRGVPFAFGPTQQIVYAGVSGNLVFLDLLTGEQEEFNFINDLSLESVSWSPNGDMIVGVYSNGLVYSYFPEYEFEGYYLKPFYHYPPRTLRFNQDSSKLAAIMSDGRIYIWSVITGELQSILVGHSTPPDDIQFLTDGRVISTSNDRIIIWDLDLNSQQVIPNPERYIISSLSPNGDFLAYITETNDLKLLETETNQVLSSIHLRADYVLSLCWSPNGQFLAAGYGDLYHYGDLVIWEVINGNTLTEFTRVHNLLVPFVFSPESTRIAAVYPDPLGLVIFDLNSNQIVDNIERDFEFIWSLSWMPSGDKILVGAWMGESYLWDYHQ